MEREGGGEGTHEAGVSGEKEPHSPWVWTCGESNNKPGVNPLPGRKLSLKPDEATAVQRESVTQTREQLLIPQERREWGLRPRREAARLCLTRTENTALLRGRASETQTPRGSCQVEGSPRLPAFTSLVLGLAVMRRRARTFNWLGQKGFLIRQTVGGEDEGWGGASQFRRSFQKRGRTRGLWGNPLPPPPHRLPRPFTSTPAPSTPSPPQPGGMEAMASGHGESPDRPTGGQGRALPQGWFLTCESAPGQPSAGGQTGPRKGGVPLSWAAAGGYCGPAPALGSEAPHPAGFSPELFVSLLPAGT